MYLRPLYMLFGGILVGVGAGLAAKEMAPRLKTLSTPMMNGLMDAGNKLKNNLQKMYFFSTEALEDMVHEIWDDKKTKRAKTGKKTNNKNTKRPAKRVKKSRRALPARKTKGRQEEATLRQ